MGGACPVGRALGRASLRGVTLGVAVGGVAEGRCCSPWRMLFLDSGAQHCLPLAGFL